MEKNVWLSNISFLLLFYIGLILQGVLYSKTCLKRNIKGPEHFSAKVRFPFNQGTLHIKIKPGHVRISDKIKHHIR